ncbi:MAG: type II toxin-antitoxin system HicB family antitoxin [Blastocatellia bacterium]
MQSQPETGYVASVIGIPGCVAEGDTEEEAIAKAKEALTQWLSRGKIVAVEIDTGEATQTDNPWLKICGSAKDDPTWDDFQANIQEYRRELDAEEAAREKEARDEAA